MCIRDSTYTETVTGTNGTCVASITEVIEISALADASWTTAGGDLMYCADESPETLIPTVSGGIFTGTGVIETAPGVYEFDPSGLEGNYSVNYTINSGVCSATMTQTMTVYPTVSADLADTHIECSNGSGSISLPSLFDGATAGGSWTISSTSGAGASISGDVLNYLGAGCYSVAYTVSSYAGAAGNTCTATDVAFIYISEQPQPSFDLAEEACWSVGGDDVVLQATVTSPSYETAATTTWTTSDASIATVDASGLVTVIGAGTVTITYEETIDNPACNGTTQTCGPVSYSQTLTVTDADVSIDSGWTAIGPFCEDDATVIDLNGEITGSTGGQFSGNGVISTGTNTYGFDASAAGAGTHAVSYCVNAGAGCSSCTTFNVEVFETRSTAINDIEICQSASGTVNLSAMFAAGTATGGTFSISNVGGFADDSNLSINNDVLTYQIDPNVDTPPFSIEITYGLTASGVGGDCDPAPSVATISITSTAETGFDLPDYWCEEDGLLDMALYTAVGGGQYTIVSGGGALVTADDYDPTGVAAAGGSQLVEILYEPALGGCGTPSTEFILIHGIADASWDNPSPVCIDELPLDLNTFVTGTLGGEWSGEGVNVTGTFNPSGAGDYVVTYTVGASDCKDEVTQTITVVAAVDAGLQSSHVVCASSSGSISLSALFTSTTTTGGTFSLGAGTIGTGVVSGEVLNYAGPGCYEIAYTVSSGAGGSCSGTATGFIFVSEQPSPSFDIAEEVCWSPNSDVITFMPTVNSPTYENPVVQDWESDNPTVVAVDASTGELTILAAGTAVISLTETITSGPCGSFSTEQCVATFSQTITVVDANESLDPSWATASGNTTYCISDSGDNLVSLGTPGGQFSGDGVSEIPLGSNNFEFSPAVAGVGIHAITYCVNAGEGCTSCYTRNIEVLPAVDATLQDAHIECVTSSGSVSLSTLFTATTVTGGTFSAGTFNGDGVLSGEVLIYNTPGCYEITYDVTSGSAGNCTATGTAFIYVSEQPEPSFDLPQEICWSPNSPSVVYMPTVNSPTYFNTAVQSWMSSDLSVVSVDPNNGEMTVVGAGTAVITLTETITQDNQCGTFVGEECEASYTQTVIITDAITSLDPTFDAIGPFCIDDATDYSLDDAVATAGGTAGGEFSGNGVTTGVAPYFFNPAAAGVGIHTITYCVSAASGCTSCFDRNVEVYDVRSTAISPITVCQSASSTIDLTSMFDGATEGGTFTIIAGSETPAFGVTASISNNTLTYVINSDILTDEYTLTVSYSLDDLSGLEGAVNGCNPAATEAVITITSTQETGFDLPDEYCEADYPIDLTMYTADGDLDGDGVVDGTYFDNDGVVISDPTTYQPLIPNGVDYLLEITYQPAEDGCSVPTTEYMWVYADVDPTWTNPSPVCESDLPLDLNDFVTGTLGGVWSGDCVDENGIFNPTFLPTACTVTYLSLIHI